MIGHRDDERSHEKDGNFMGRTHMFIAANHNKRFNDQRYHCDKKRSFVKSDKTL